MILGEAFPAVEAFFWDFTVSSLEHLGPCFVKLSRWMAIKADVFPKELLERVRTMHGQARTGASMEAAEAALDAAFGQSWRSKFVLERPAVGAEASPATLWRGCKGRLIKRIVLPPAVKGGAAVTLPVGTAISVRVRDAVASEAVRSDLAVVDALGALADQYCSLETRTAVDVTRAFVRRMHSQLDLSVEEQNVNRLNRNFGARGQPSVAFPHPLAGLQSPSVCVSTEANGETLSAFRRRVEGLPGGRSLLDQLTDASIKALVQMAFAHNFLLCDAFEGERRG